MTLQIQKPAGEYVGYWDVCSWLGHFSYTFAKFCVIFFGGGTERCWNAWRKEYLGDLDVNQKIILK
jgi:hypothetical protein